MGFEDEVEQSLPRPCREMGDRFKTLVSLTDTSNPAKWSMLRFSF